MKMAFPLFCALLMCMAGPLFCALLMRMTGPACHNINIWTHELVWVNKLSFSYQKLIWGNSQKKKSNGQMCPPPKHLFFLTKKTYFIGMLVEEDLLTKVFFHQHPYLKNLSGANCGVMGYWSLFWGQFFGGIGDCLIFQGQFWGTMGYWDIFQEVLTFFGGKWGLFNMSGAI